MTLRILVMILSLAAGAAAWLVLARALRDSTLRDLEEDDERRVGAAPPDDPS